MPLDRCEEKNGQKCPKPNACYHHSLFAVCSNVAPKFSNVWSPRLAGLVCDGLMTCKCQSRKAPRGFNSNLPKSRFRDFSRRPILTFPSSFNLSRYSNKQCTWGQERTWQNNAWSPSQASNLGNCAIDMSRIKSIWWKNGAYEGSRFDWSVNLLC